MNTKRIILIIAILGVIVFSIAAIKYVPFLAPVISAQSKTVTQLMAEERRLNTEFVGIIQQEVSVDPALVNVLTAPISESTIDSPKTAEIASEKKGQEGSSITADQIPLADSIRPQSYDVIVNTYLNEIEDFKSVYSVEILALMAKAKAEYHNLPADQKRPEEIMRIGFKYADMALAMEADADDRFNLILTNLESELLASGNSTEIVGKMKTYYVQFKKIQKQSYIAEIKAASKK